MNRPVSILCLSDLHYDCKGNMEALNQLGVSLNRYVNENVDHLRWQPDYLVIAGDLAEKATDYDAVGNFLDGVLKCMPWLKDRIIIVPGNHDKDAPSSKSDIKKEKDTFDDFCKNTSSGKQNFCDWYHPLFKDYIAFCERYLDGVEFDELVLDEKLKLLGSLKYYENDNICFLMVNTEWLYVRKSLFKEEGVKWANELYRIDANCKLCAPIVKSVCQIVEKKYPDALVVTIMHRPFEYLTWDENNHHNDFDTDSVRMLLNLSDVIVTGHDHTINTMPPLMINNRVQHYKIGSAGRKEKLESEEIRTASIIRVDPLNKETSLLHLKYDPFFERNGGWIFWEEQGKFPVVQRYNSNESNLVVSDVTQGCVVLRAKNDTANDLREAICRHFCDVQAENLILIDAATDVDKQLSCISFQKKGCYVVVYFKCSVFYMDGELLIDRSWGVIDKVKRYRIEHMSDIFNSEMSFNFVFIEVPKIFS